MIGSQKTRKSHRKSRLGCKNCKARKIKCDENKPNCDNCVKYRTQCDFQPKENGPVTLSPRPALNVDDLELLFNFTTLTYATLSDSITMRDFYRITIVQMGFKCQYMLRSVLSLSALHMANYRSDQREHYYQTAIAHHQFAIAEASSLVPTAKDAEQAENLYFFSMLAVFIGLASSQQETEHPPIHESGLPSWLFLLRGTMSMLDLIPPDRQRNCPLSPIFSHGIEIVEARENSLSEGLTLSQTLAEFAHETAERVDLDHSLKKIYLEAIGQLEKSYAALCTGRSSWDRSFVFMWLFMQADKFLPLLQSPTPEALCILAFFCVLLKKLDYLWCIKGCPDDLLKAILALFKGSPPSCVKAVIEEIGYVQ